MKWFFFFAVMILGFFGVMTASVRPDVVEAKYEELRQPIEQHFAEKDKTTWEEAKRAEHAKWMLQLKLPADCATTTKQLRQLECKSQKLDWEAEFEKSWNEQVRSGWKPQGIDN